MLAAGAFFGLCSLLFIEVTHFFRKTADRLAVPRACKPLIGGAALVVLTFLFSTRYLGLGMETVRAALAGQPVAWYAFLLKIIFTAVTLGFGGSGGVVTPIFFIGTTSGLLFAALAGADPGLFAAIGFVALLAGAANTPIAAAVTSAEMFGAEILAYTSVACVISFFITGHRSIFPSQVLNIRKSTSIDVQSGRDMENLSMTLRKRRRSLLGFISRLADGLGRRFRGKG